MREFDAYEFTRESNRIEGILRDPTEDEVDALVRFVGLSQPTVADVEAFVAVCAPGKPLRRQPGMNVRVGSHIAPAGGPEIEAQLADILEYASIGDDPWMAHVQYETLHPFMDGNGRSGRALWAWQMVRAIGGCPLGFLHHFYYQTLERRAR
jgi:hypothetical protein